VVITISVMRDSYSGRIAEASVMLSDDLLRVVITISVISYSA